MTPMKLVTVRRWEIALAFLVNVVSLIVVTVLLTNAIHANHHALRELRDTKANVSALERSNCALRDFLLVAARARTVAASHESAVQARIDRRTARTYRQLADNLDNPLCHG